MKKLKPKAVMMAKVPHVVINTPAGKISVLLEALTEQQAQAFDEIMFALETKDSDNNSQFNMKLKAQFAAERLLVELYFLCGSMYVEEYPTGLTEDEQDAWDDLGRLNQKRFNKLYPYQQADFIEEWHEAVATYNLKAKN